MKEYIIRNVLTEGFRAFFDIQAEEKILSAEVAKKATILTISRLVFVGVDWVVAALLASFSFWLQASGFDETQVFFATWLYDFSAAALFFFVSDRTKYDFTLGQSLRRVADSFGKERFSGKLFSVLFLLGFSIKAIIWEGPEVICFLFKKELKSRSNIWLALFLLSAGQGVFGTWLYTTGFNLWQRFGPTELGSHYALLGIATFIIFVFVVAILKKIVQVVIKAIIFCREKNK